MSSALLRRLIEEEERKPVEVAHDLIDGVCVERRVSIESGWVGYNVGYKLGTFALPTRAGRVYPADVGYKIFAEPSPLKFPDVSFVRAERLTPEVLADTFFPIPPDIAVEVVSPPDTAWNVNAKAAAWISVGTRLLWVIYPVSHHVYVFRASGSPTVLQDGDQLSGEDVLPGFSIDVSSLFIPD